MHLAYEDLITDVDGQVSRLAAFMGVTDPACLAAARGEVGTGWSRMDPPAKTESDKR